MDTEDNAAAAPSISFSVNDIPGKNRRGAIRDYLSEMMHVEVEPADLDIPFQYSADLRFLPDVSFGHAFSSAVVTHRTRQLLKDAQDDLMLVMPEARMTILMPNRDDLVIEPGGAALVSQAREMRLVHHETAASWAVRMPHRNMARMLVGLSAAPVLALPQGTPMLEVLRRFRRVLDGDPLRHVAERELTSRQLQEIIAGTIRHSAGYVGEAEENGLLAVRLRTVKADIDDNLGNIHLNLEWIAARQKVSSRYVRKLFEREGTSFSDHLRKTRLARVYSMLIDPRNSGRTINSIAHECGFPEASSMNRAFREEYGMTPSDVRGRN
ncbi:helix-turn-helix transcriptional regulator [Shinella zoogloeoides]|uniref:Helix-turn-helix domain-containing protein n=1 Tax=Shinella zoogloeoides TaxID=352475 RepID=A0A6N8TMF9_SHIZO|nr:AraC family transcriptional regulator [Shinella zoogloeoides]MXO02418.1 helix-turn-helix domain-containing protein [Shinella zoogloeoides]UEX80396.1 AraC family transcriptional regulator [Shinella zoogloeoides]